MRSVARRFRASALGAAKAAHDRGIAVQLALDRGILSATFTQSPVAAAVSPNGSVTRSDLAFALDHYRQAFAAGN